MAQVAELPETQEKEFELAKAEGRQPRCIHCGKPLDKVLETQYCDLTWTWDVERKVYIKSENGESATPFCANCEAKDWEFTNNDFIDY